MLKGSLDSYPEENRSLLVEFKIREGVKMYTQLPDYDDFMGFDLSNAPDLAGISERISTGFRSRHV